MSNQVVSLDDDAELHMSAAALKLAVSQVADACPRLVGVGWIVNGKSGALAVVREESSTRMVLPDDAKEQCKCIAQAIAALPDFVAERVNLELTIILDEKTLKRFVSKV